MPLFILDKVDSDEYCRSVAYHTALDKDSFWLNNVDYYNNTNNNTGGI